MLGLCFSTFLSVFAFFVCCMLCCVAVAVDVVVALMFAIRYLPASHSFANSIFCSFFLSSTSFVCLCECTQNGISLLLQCEFMKFPISVADESITYKRKESYIVGYVEYVYRIDHRRHHIEFTLYNLHCRLCSSVFSFTGTTFSFPQIGFQCICTL